MAISSLTSVVASSVDLIQRAQSGPETNLAIIVGPSVRGPAFIPISFSELAEFEKVFAKVNSSNFAKIAMKNWLTFSNGSYLRLLGAGDCKRRIKTGENAGKVNRAGFIVGQELVSTASGIVAQNHRAYDHGPPGRTYFLGCFMSESEGSTIFSDAGLQHATLKDGRPEGAIPILRGVLMAPSGVILSLGTKAASNNIPGVHDGIGTNAAQGFFGKTGDAGLSFGDVNTKSGTHQEITLLLNGFKPTDDYPNVITASLDPTAPSDSSDTPSYITTAFNTNPTLIQEAGHYLHTFYDIDLLWAVITGSGITTHHDDLSGTPSVGARKYQTAFLLTSSFARNSGSKSEPESLGCPNFENFENRYASAYSPWVVSQKIGGKAHNLFKIHALSDGKPDTYPNTFDPSAPNGKPLKITIKNIRPATVEGQFCQFNLMVRDWYNPDEQDLAEGSETKVESFNDLSLDPSSDNFIAKRIGDMHAFYNFDKPHLDQRIEIPGRFPNVSRFIRVEVADEVNEAALGDNIMPIGFRGINHLILSGSTSRDGAACPILTGSADAIPGSVGTIYSTMPSAATYHGIKSDILGRISQIPLPMREHVAYQMTVGATTSIVPRTTLSWGTQFERKTKLDYTNQVETLTNNVRSLVEYFPDFHTNYQNPWVGENEGNVDVNGSILDADRYNKNFFTLEYIEVILKATGLPDPGEWAAARYRRGGKSVGSLPSAAGVETSSRLLIAEKDFFATGDNPITPYLQFTFPLQGGFNGYNIFDPDKSNFRDLAIKREISDNAQGRKNGPSYAAYKTGLEIIQDKNYDFKILATPGIRQRAATDLGVIAAEERFDMFYVMDVEQKDESLEDVQISGNDVHAVNTIEEFTQRNVDSSFAAAYFPDVFMADSSIPGAEDLRIPPSVAIMGVLSKNDATYGVGVRPTGINRGSLKDFASSTATILEDSEVQKAYENKLNAIKEIASSGGSSSDGSPGPIIQSQTTTLNNESHMSRIDIRRLVIEIRRMTRRLALTTLFEQNTRNTRNFFRGAVSRSLLSYVALGFIKQYAVTLEDTTQSDIERNIIRGKVMIVPKTLSEELFIDLDIEL